MSASTYCQPAGECLFQGLGLHPAGSGCWTRLKWNILWTFWRQLGNKTLLPHDSEVGEEFRVGVSIHVVVQLEVGMLSRSCWSGYERGKPKGTDPTLMENAPGAAGNMCFSLQVSGSTGWVSRTSFSLVVQTLGFCASYKLHRMTFSSSSHWESSLNGNGHTRCGFDISFSGASALMNYVVDSPPGRIWSSLAWET